MSSDSSWEAPIFSEDGAYKIALEKAAVWDDPIDKIEPETATQSDPYKQGLRDAAKRYLFIMNTALSSIIEAENSRNAAWAVAFALSSGICAGKTMDAVGDQLGIGRAAISKSAKAFCRATNIAPSLYMKRSESSAKYRKGRINSIEAANNASVTTKGLTS